MNKLGRSPLGDAKGHQMNKLGRSPLGDATYKISKL